MVAATVADSTISMGIRTIQGPEEPDLFRVVQAFLSGNATLRDVEKVLDDGASADHWDHSTTPLRHAVQAHRPALVKSLLSRRANPNKEDENMVTALHIASFDGDIACVKALLAGRAEVNQQDKHGQTPLFFAPSRQACELLISANADVSIKNAQQQTALHLMAYAGLHDATECLVEHVGTDALEILDANGRSVHHYASKSKLRSSPDKSLLPASTVAESLVAKLAVVKGLHKETVSFTKLHKGHQGRIGLHVARDERDKATEEALRAELLEAQARAQKAEEHLVEAHKVASSACEESVGVAGAQNAEDAEKLRAELEEATARILLMKDELTKAQQVAADEHRAGCSEEDATLRTELQEAKAHAEKVEQELNALREASSENVAAPIYPEAQQLRLDLEEAKAHSERLEVELKAAADGRTEQQNQQEVMLRAELAEAQAHAHKVEQELNESREASTGRTPSPPSNPEVHELRLNLEETEAHSMRLAAELKAAADQHTLHNGEVVSIRAELKEAEAHAENLEQELTAAREARDADPAKETDGFRSELESFRAKAKELETIVAGLREAKSATCGVDPVEPQSDVTQHDASATEQKAAQEQIPPASESSALGGKACMHALEVQSLKREPSSEFAALGQEMTRQNSRKGWPMLNFSDAACDDDNACREEKQVGDDMTYWNVILKKEHEDDKFGFMQANGKAEFINRLQMQGPVVDGGLDMGPEVLIVRKIHESGLLERWNKRHPQLQVRPQDRIVSVNDSTTVEAMQKQLRSIRIAMRVMRLNDRFRVHLEKKDQKLGLRFERPRSATSESALNQEGSLRMQNTEIRILEVLVDGLVMQYNLEKIQQQQWNLVVLPGMRIEGANNITGNATNIAMELKQAEELVIHIRRAEMAWISQDQVRNRLQMLSTMQSGLSRNASEGGESLSPSAGHVNFTVDP